jgi:hypothetical protein
MEIDTLLLRLDFEQLKAFSRGLKDAFSLEHNSEFACLHY